MHDSQLFYWPEKDCMLCISLYLDGSFKLESEDLSDKDLKTLAFECTEQAMEAEDYLSVKGLIFLDHIPVLELKNQ
jgi:hypothetical protein